MGNDEKYEDGSMDNYNNYYQDPNGNYSYNVDTNDYELVLEALPQTSQFYRVVGSAPKAMQALSVKNSAQAESENKRYTFNSSNVVYRVNDDGTTSNEIWYYKAIDNSYFCDHWGAYWYLYCDPI
tara:strand:- start:5245 stop:5619 length:375 start_codon:yes stop_codon:yes gene_type:complete